MIKNKLNSLQKSLGITISIVIILFYFLFNFNYLSTWIDEKGDSITYEHYVKLGIPQFLYNPHHIAFDWLGGKFHSVLKNNGYTGALMISLQLRNLIISSIGLGILFYLFYKFSKKIMLSLLIILPLSFTAAYWMYSQINDTPIIHSVLLAILFFAAIHFPNIKKKYLYSVFLGLFHAVTVFFHQSDIIFMIVISFVILFHDFFKEKSDFTELSFLKNTKIKLSSYKSLQIKNFNFFMIYLLTLSIILISAYFYVGVVLIGLTLDPAKAGSFNKIKNSTYFFNWLILYTKIDYWGKGYETNLFVKIITGLSTYFYEVKEINNKTVSVNFINFFSKTSILPNFITLFFSFVVILQTIYFSKIYKKYGIIYLANLLFIIIYFIFTCWWEPDYREFWVAPMFSFWILALFTFNHVLDSVKNFKPLIKSFLYTFMTILTLLLFYYNFIYFIYPNSSKTFQKFNIVKSIKNL